MGAAKKVASDKLERFIAIKEVTRPQDQYPAYQAEILTIRGEEVVSREMVGKPDLFEYAFTNAGNLIDPRSL